MKTTKYRLVGESYAHHESSVGPIELSVHLARWESNFKAPQQITLEGRAVKESMNFFFQSADRDFEIGFQRHMPARIDGRPIKDLFVDGQVSIGVSLQP